MNNHNHYLWKKKYVVYSLYAHTHTHTHIYICEITYVCMIVSLISLMRKLKHKEVKKLAQGCLAGNWHKENSTSGYDAWATLYHWN